MTLGEWLEDNPRARPLLMFGLVVTVLLMVGILIGMSEKPKDKLVSESTQNQTVRPQTTSSPVPTGGGEETMGQTPVRPKVAWINEKDAPAWLQPDLKLPPTRKFQQWDEVSHIRENDNWDLVRAGDGQEVWIQSRYITFTRPANLDKPSEAELTVMAFYQAVERKDYAQAYSFLAAPWKAELDFRTFVDGYSRTLGLRTEIRRVLPLGQDRFQVDVNMIANEVGKEVTYSGHYVVQKFDDRWDMTEGSLRRADGPAPASQPNIQASPGLAQPEETPSAAPEEDLAPPSTPQVPTTPGAPADDVGVPAATPSVSGSPF